MNEDDCLIKCHNCGTLHKLENLQEIKHLFYWKVLVCPKFPSTVLFIEDPTFRKKRNIENEVENEIEKEPTDYFIG